MAKCLNKNSVEFQTKLKMSGLSEFKFTAIALSFVDKHNRFPELDEIPQANSEPFLLKDFDINSYEDVKFIDNKKLLEKTGSNTVEEAVIKLNNIYRDLEINIVPVSESSIIQIRHRPNRWSEPYIENKVSNTENVNNAILFNQVLSNLAKLYGLKFIPITNDELQEGKWKTLVMDSKLTNAFIYNNDIYINTDNSSIDAPIHEMLHLFLGSIRFSNPELYNSLVSLMDNLPNRELLSRNYLDRTHSDVNEELFVTEFAKYVTGQQNALSDLPNDVLYEIFYNINRVLDSVLFGKQSASTLKSGDLFLSSLSLLINKLGSDLSQNKYSGSLDINSSLVHRILLNVKSDLINKGDLIENCI